MLSCGVCEDEHADTAAFAEAHPDEANRERVQFALGIQPDVSTGVLTAVVSFPDALAKQMRPLFAAGAVGRF